MLRVRYSSLFSSGRSIVNAKNLFEFAKDFKKKYMAFSTHEKYSEEKALLQERFDKSTTIPGTQKFAYFYSLVKDANY